MTSLSRVWMAAGVAVINGHSDQACKLKSLIKSFRQGKKAFASSSSSDHPPSDLRPLSGFLGSTVDLRDRKTRSDDSLRQVIYLTCWGPS
ncbi:hypothetical protein Ccrd_002009 [Cynara cardunculus var. scolymus]|uniref:Wound-responsive family protein n=1 Tax=Cynara cardunculus var. scolymus TaxID=59895 RepID=A0A103XS69_CYNCS|nr:hypothetical protein Ccrd_002009 [Cynara cardunculus var. scolymus]